MLPSRGVRRQTLPLNLLSPSATFTGCVPPPSLPFFLSFRLAPSKSASHHRLPPRTFGFHLAPLASTSHLRLPLPPRLSRAVKPRTFDIRLTPSASASHLRLPLPPRLSRAVKPHPASAITPSSLTLLRLSRRQALPCFGYHAVKPYQVEGEEECTFYSSR